MKNNSDIGKMMKDAGILFAVTLIAGLVLGFIYELTKEPIRIQQEKAIQESCRVVFEDASEFVEIGYTPGEEMTARLAETGVKIGTVYDAQSADGSHMGYVVESITTQGYGGNITIYLGVASDGTLNGISILDISETPGLGMRAEEDLAPQFRNKKVSEFSFTKTGSKSDSEIDAITAATITTRAVTNAVNGGLLVVAEDLQEGGSGNE